MAFPFSLALFSVPMIATARDRRYILGHEDVHPLARWGWDPGAGFDWGRVMKATEGTPGAAASRA